MKVSRYCSCGGAMQGTITPNAKAKKLLEIWDSIHSGIGHKVVDSVTASKARRKEEWGDFSHTLPNLEKELKSE